MMRRRLRHQRKKIENSYIFLDAPIADQSQSQEKSTFIPGSFDPELNGNNDAHSHELKKSDISGCWHVFSCEERKL